MNQFKPYIDRGYYLFPLWPKEKKPHIKGWQDAATLDPEKIKNWAKRFPQCGWGIYLKKSNLVAVDIDRKHGGLEAWQAFCGIHKEPEGPKAKTKNGGLHYLFKAKENIRYKGKIQDGIDIKHNGYTIVFPTPGYKWLRWKTTPKDAPQWLTKLIEKSENNKLPNLKLEKNYLKTIVKNLKEFELTYPEWVRAGMAIHATEPNDLGLELYLNLTQGVSYIEGDLEKARTKWEGFKNETDGIGPMTLSYLLHEKGGDVPNPWLAEDLEAFEQAENPKEEMEGFKKLGDKFVVYNRKNLVKSFNDMGIAFLKSGKTAPFLRIIESTSGTREVMTMNEKAMKDLMAPYFLAVLQNEKKKLIPAFRQWVESSERKEYERIVFRPHANDNELNLWSDFPIIPIHGKRPDAILRLIHHSLCNGDKNKTNWLLDWLAHLLQRPWERVSVVPVLISKQGVGKGLLMDHIMAPMLGNFYTVVTTAAELTARFNVGLSKKFLTFIDEATWRGNKTEDGLLKRLVGSPTMSVEEKFGHRYQIENYSRYLIGSNNPEAVAIEVGNRRYVPIEASDKLAGDLDFYDPIAKEIRKGDLVREFAGYLLDRPLNGFCPHAVLKNNMGGRQAKIKTLGAVGEFWEDIFFESPRSLWIENRGLLQSAAYDEFIIWARRANHWSKGLSERRFWADTKIAVPEIPESKQIWINKTRHRFREIRPLQMLKEFCKNCIISMPDLFEEQDYYIKSE